MNSSPKGQVEIMLQICEAEPHDDDESNDAADSSVASANKKDEQKRRMSFNDVKNRLKNLNLSKKEKYRGMCLKVTTSKMRCSIKVKEEFENFGGREIAFLRHYGKDDLDESHFRHRLRKNDHIRT